MACDVFLSSEGARPLCQAVGGQKMGSRHTV